MLEAFRKEGREHQLLILRPSCFAPAQEDPFPHFEVAGSSPVTTMRYRDQVSSLVVVESQVAVVRRWYGPQKAMHSRQLVQGSRLLISLPRGEDGSGMAADESRDARDMASLDKARSCRYVKVGARLQERRFQCGWGRDMAVRVGGWQRRWYRDLSARHCQDERSGIGLKCIALLEKGTCLEVEQGTE